MSGSDEQIKCNIRCKNITCLIRCRGLQLKKKNGCEIKQLRLLPRGLKKKRIKREENHNKSDHVESASYSGDRNS